MAHNCIDWTTKPPTRQNPLLVLRRGDDRVFTTVPDQLKTLEDIVRKEFGLGDCDLHILSGCINRCDGIPARITTESAWETVSAYIGCVTVEVVGARPEEDRAPREEPPRTQDMADEPNAGAKRKRPVDEDHRLSGRPITSARIIVREDEETTLVHGDHPITPESPPEEPGDEEVNTVFPRKPSRMASEDEDEDKGDEDRRNDNESEREPGLAVDKASAPVSPLKPSGSLADPITLDKEIKEERKNDYREPDEQPASEPDRPIKQEKRDRGSASQPQPLSQPAESGDFHKVMIRVAHRPSKQESKFTTKSTTKVGKVLAGACRSFGLDANRTTMYLIVPTEDEDGQVENLFPCDKGDSIARAGAEQHTESRFLLKVAGEE